MTLAARLIEDAKASGLVVAPALADACATHHQLLVRWNKTHNLTRVTEPADAAQRHYLDCLWPALVAPPEERRDFVDVGSGAGFPGLLVALAWPDRAGTLIEPARKRASFLRIVIAELGLAGRVTVADPPAAPAALVLSRATFSRGMREPLASAVAPGGYLWLWSVPGEEADWAAEAMGLGLRALPPLTRTIGGELRVILRAER